MCNYKYMLLLTQVYPRPPIAYEDLNKVQKFLYKVMVSNQQHGKQLFHTMLYYSIIQISIIKINHKLII